VNLTHDKNTSVVAMELVGHSPNSLAHHNNQANSCMQLIELSTYQPNIALTGQKNNGCGYFHGL
jgi:hypothetical protein